MEKIQWPIKPHTLAKHAILRSYLGAWFPILGKDNRNLVYLDGFCGPGRYSTGEDGSPLIALNEALKHSQRLQNNFITFLFIDKDPSRIVQLNQEIQALSIPPNFVIKPLVGEFAQELKAGLDDLDRNGLQLAPTFAFIDPFGFSGIPFTLVQRLLRNPKTEVFINIMVESINRFLDHPTSKIQQNIIDLFGTDKVTDIAQTGGDRLHSLIALYHQQLRKYAQYVRYFEMRDDRNKIIYYLFFASNHRLGHVKMKEAFWKIDKSSGFKFSDTTNPNQLVLFDTDPSHELALTLSRLFTGQKVSVFKIRLFVENETPFTASHMKKSLSYLENSGIACVSPCKTGGQKRIRGSFPDDAVIEFQAGDINRKNVL